MRQVEFRFYDPFNAVMTYSDNARDLMEFFYWYQKTVDGENDPIIMQYTGLQDANGQKIFEGDVLKAFNSTKEINITGIVCFHSGTYKLKRIIQTSSAIKHGYIDFVAYWSDGTHDWETIEQYQEYELETIGNIYQNKELLNEVKNEQD